MSSADFDACLDEISRRAPDFLRRFALELPSPHSKLLRPSSYPALAGISDADASRCLDQAVRYFSDLGIQFKHSGQEPDPVSEVLFASLLDGLAAQRGPLVLTSAPSKPATLATILSENFVCRSSPNNDCRTFIRLRGQHDLVLINAVGVSAKVWSRFLQDDLHPFRVILLESPGSDLLSGGVRGAADISSDADAIAQALEREAITNATVVAWCNGGRVALELAARFPERVSSLVLLAPTCLGAGDAELPGSSFEESLNIVAKAAINQPKLAELLASTLQPTAALDWDRVANSPAARAKMLFRLPATEYARELFAPFATGESLLHYARRCLSDLAHDQERTLGLIRQPVMLITGEADDIVNNSLTLATLRRTLNEFVHVSLSGAGHYIHDLQYPYLLWALHHWHADKDLLRSTARARVERISR